VLNSVVTNAWYLANSPSLIQAAINALEYPVGTGNPPVVWSATHPADRTLIEQGFVDPILRYQRRREVGVGV
jgi:hypothetical protein